ncbi:type II toxin-antitoxin system RelE/ParE family toxin [Pectobacterium versatile]|uniref:Type II toxin-antitoxin system RelE/ParE family toxin n=1 Tax=Pectobacterium versatile TaxID=2488639 RepID=A0AAW3RUM3_9GAMM|nr:type II toxin-antitoxin system RelE/ParE family toxin [Pectobacterium versatile]AZK61437.1 type II toxin-antitoxin system RelE/ParE family toxin [Pectobacterium versatile]MBA0160405.1 type II toxin-antitoxin system RelE/ParE family toxin [Pectobacterium versatile]MBN3237519.1 type II toxin-antitoxin system RelE/ParE family toxin [Pectobacterium versatile]TAI98619.1 type II toxin-antitoxin system RelE/ParE family toxin [Pectobacterium versatile]UEQ08134.1 type II toxin-antitoxin system RelE/
MTHIVWTGKAVKDLRKLPVNDQKAIQANVNSLEGYPTTKSKPLDITKLTDRGSEYRLRVGNYRVLFEIQKGEPIIIEIQRVLRLTSTTY